MFTHQRHTQKNLNQKGFTLVEVMTAVSIFAIIMVIGMGALLSTVGASKQAQAQRKALDSLNFIVDAMAREIRTGSKYVIGSDPGAYVDGGAGHNGVGSAFSFHNQDSCPVTYRLDSGTGVIQRRRGGACALGVGYNNLTDPSIIEITHLEFLVRGADADIADTEQPFVAFIVTAQTLVGGKRSEITLQSAVTQRLLDIPVAI